MINTSTQVIFLISLVVLALSFKDLMLIKIAKTDSSTTKTSNGGVNLNLDEGAELESSPATNAKLKTNKSDDFEDDESEDTGFTDSAMPVEDSVKEIPSLKMKSNVQTLKFLFCYSCGYRNMFEQYSQLIHSKYPELKIVGENYTPNAIRVYVAQFLSSFKLILIGLVIFGQNPFIYINMPTPSIYNWAIQNKLYACMMIFFLSNAIETQLITSGAFEIYLNDLQIWSKLQSDRMPHEKELLQILDMNFNFEPEKNSGFNPNGRDSIKMN